MSDADYWLRFWLIITTGAVLFADRCASHLDHRLATEAFKAALESKP